MWRRAGSKAPVRHHSALHGKPLYGAAHMGDDLQSRLINFVAHLKTCPASQARAFDGAQTERGASRGGMMISARCRVCDGWASPRR